MGEEIKGVIYAFFRREGMNSDEVVSDVKVADTIMALILTLMACWLR